MIEGNYDINFITDKILQDTHFPEKNSTEYANGIWEKFNTDKPNFPTGSAVVYQAFGDQAPDWAHKIKDMFNWMDNKQVTINKITPGCFIPPHIDEFFKLKQYLGTDNSSTYDIVRATMFVTDHKLGHIINIEGNSIDTYSKGDYAFIRSGQIHTVANLGHEDRYTLQVTGTIK